MDPGEIKKSLRGMGRVELAEMRRYIDGIAQFQDNRELPPGGSLMLEVLEAECGKLGLGKYLNPNTRLAVQRHGRNLEEWLEQACPGAELVVRRTVLAKGILLLYRNLSRKGMAVTPTILADNLGRLPAVLDRAFPGYARLGILGRMVHNAG